MCSDGDDDRGFSMATAGGAAPVTHRYLIERTFPAGALDGVDAAAKQKVNANNKTLNVTWEKSYANADKTKTYCVYTGRAKPRCVKPRSSTDCRSTTSPRFRPTSRPSRAAPCSNIAAGNHRYLVKRSGVAGRARRQRPEVRRDAAHLVRHRGQEQLVLGVRSPEFLGGGKRGQGERRAVRVDRRRFRRRCTRTEVSSVNGHCLERAAAASRRPFLISAARASGATLGPVDELLFDLA